MAPRAGMIRHLRPADLSERWGVPEETLRDWRKDGKGPKYVRGDSAGDKATIFYREIDVEEWEKAHLIDPAMQRGLPAAVTA